MAEQRLAVLLSHLQPSPAVPASLAARPGLQPEPRPQQLVVPANNGPIVVVGGVVLDVQASAGQGAMAMAMTATWARLGNGRVQQPWHPPASKP